MSILFNKEPLTINRELAELIGLNEAIILQQMHFWLEGRRNYIDGKYWVYNSITEWKKQFTFFSESTIRRTLEKLNQLGLLFIAEHNRDRRDRTKWYSINYDSLNELVKNASVQNEQMQLVKMDNCTSSNCTSAVGQNEQTITKEYYKEYTKNSTENIEESKSQKIRRASQIPNDFIPKQNHHDLANELHVDLNQEFLQFKDYHKAKGTVFKNWDAAFNNWLRNAKKFRGSKTSQPFTSREDRNKQVIGNMEW